MKTQSVTAAGLLARATRIFIDTAPVIYFVEQHPRYLPLVRPVFDRIDAGALTLVTSPITLAECLVLPLRNGQTDIVELFTELLTRGPFTRFVVVDQPVGALAAELRVRCNLHLPDALQAAVAVLAGCDAFLTNDPILRRVAELNVVVLDELQQANQ
jgi:predicted nucleic acid-binding protein